MQTPCKKFVRTERGPTNSLETRRSFEKAIAMTRALSDEHVMIDITLNNRRLRAMLDSGASGNFVAERYAHYHNLPIRRKTVVYPLVSVDGSAIGGGRVTNETTVMLEIEEHRERITLDIVDMVSHDVILGIPWLRKWNPHID